MLTNAEFQSSKIIIIEAVKLQWICGLNARMHLWEVQVSGFSPDHAWNVQYDNAWLQVNRVTARLLPNLSPRGWQGSKRSGVQLPRQFRSSAWGYLDHHHPSSQGPRGSFWRVPPPPHLKYITSFHCSGQVASCHRSPPNRPPRGPDLHVQTAKLWILDFQCE